MTGSSRRNRNQLRHRDLTFPGQTNKDMADALHISPKTVGRHIENIYAKTRVSTRASATVFALQQGIVGT